MKKLYSVSSDEKEKYEIFNLQMNILSSIPKIEVTKKEISLQYT